MILDEPRAGAAVSLINMLAGREFGLRLSGSFLPLPRIAAGMKTGNHGQGVILDDKKQRIRKPAQEGCGERFYKRRKLPGIISHSLDQGVNRLAKAAS